MSVLAGADPQPWRRLLLGVAATGAVLAGATRRWQAPVLLGGGVLTLLALHEVARGWDLLPPVSTWGSVGWRWSGSPPPTSGVDVTWLDCAPRWAD